jgi:hypothetical protein
MTECLEQLTFDYYHHKHLVADFKGGAITSDAGLLPVRQMEARLGWLTEAAGALVDERDPSRTLHDVLTLLRQRVFGLIGGYEDGNDHTRMRNDPALKLIAERPPEGKALASQPTVSRFENAPSARQVVRLNRLLIGHVIAEHKERRSEEIVLDVDPTDDPCHGHQQQVFFNGFYDQHMLFPLLVFDRATGLLAGVRLRAGNASGAHRVLQLLRPMVRRLKKALPKVKIIIRADAGLAVPRLYRFCEENALGYLIGIATNNIFKKTTEWAVAWLSERFEKSPVPYRWIGGFRHRAGTWRRERRILFKAEINAEGSNRRFVVTNLPGLPLHLWPRYEDRGTAETFIDQLKNALKADRLSCHRFIANAFRLVMTAFAYNLIRAFAMQLKGTCFESASAETIRSRLLKIGAQVCETTRRVWVHLATGFPHREVLLTVMRRIRNMRPPPVTRTAW